MYSGTQPQVFSVRVVSLDYYMAPPIPGLDISYSSFHGGKVNEVPVIRIYGSTPASQKTCLHIHQVLPYLYIPCSDLGSIGNEVDSHTHSISLSLEKALKLKASAVAKRQHVYGCDLVRARKFYGYHSSEELFVKIYFYYPQDVSRAAKLLLAGAISNKILQPYESHIPFLLQFLIDYNLYGMSHVHVSKMKFRNPVPDVFSLRKVKHNGKLRPLPDDSTCLGSQADLGGDLCSNLPVWISSTIPDGWIWLSSSQRDFTTNEDIPQCRRQSTCELEGDAVVHDIINQQFIPYAPLSQTDLDVKMVQSLIPIWQEEHERNGVPEAIQPESEKPLPQDVLRLLSDGLEFEKFMDVGNDGDSCPLLTPESIDTSAEFGNSVDPVTAKHDEHNHHLPSKYLKARDKLGPLLSIESPFQNVDVAETNETDAAEQRQTSVSMEPSSAKATDEDALRLLKWLASSQAAEDINSDDELTRETILSPLLPSQDIDKMLEKANVDYESESQKECQDILDSIDILNFEESNSRDLNLAEDSRSSGVMSNRMIPQVDGSSDDLHQTPCSDELIKSVNIGAMPCVEVQPWPELNSNLTSSNRSKRPRWGSLPISYQKVTNVRQPDTSCTLNAGDDEEEKEGLVTSCSGNDGERLQLAKVDEEKAVFCTEQTSAIVECSTRDLMRRKRSQRIELSGCRSPADDLKAAPYSDGEPTEGAINLDSKLWSDTEDKVDFLSPIDKPPVTKFHEHNINSSVEMCKTIKPTSSHLPTFGKLPLFPSKDSTEAGKLPKNDTPEHLVKVDCCDSYCGEYVSNCADHGSDVHDSSCKLEHTHVSKTEVTNENLGCTVLQTAAVVPVLLNSAISDDTSKTDFITGSGCQTAVPMCELPDIPADDSKDEESETTLVQSKMSPFHGKNPDLSNPYDTSENVYNETETSNLIGLTLPKKPPTIDWTHELESEAPELLRTGGSNVGKFADDCLPFFTMNCLEELQDVSPGKCGQIDSHEPIMGVPILYQNDGSYLFMLTPALTPPSRESVDRWLQSDSSGISRQKIDAKSSYLPLAEGSFNDTMDSQNSQADDSNSLLPESTSLSDVKSNVNQLVEHNQVNSRVEVKTLNGTMEKLSAFSQDTSQISGPDKKMRLTPLSQIGFRDPASIGRGQQLTLLSIEIQAESRGDLRPDPQFDAVNIVVLVFQEDEESTFDSHVLLRCDSVSVEKDLDAVAESSVFVFTEESKLFNHLTNVICASDPDVLMGWDVQSGSLGFLAERAAHLGIGLLNNISRTPSQINAASVDPIASQKEMVKEKNSESVIAEAVHLENMIIEDEWGRTHASGVHVGGRIVLNIWRLMRGEVKLNMYSVEAVAETVLRRKIPYIPWKVLTKWYSSGPGRARYRSISYTLERAKLNLEIMNQLDMINRTSELARVFGIDFFSVLSRGSQYRVESMFLRLAHTQNYLAISPGNQQVANQPAMECLPLVMEPESNFYADPVIVLDFQSLYPSMVIGYNLCFCTCLGKITPSKANTLGVSSYTPDTNILHNLKHELLVTPNGVVYVPSKVRQGVLPRLLDEILSTRIMVKQAMKKLTPSERVLHRILNARQLALKLIANVTYGYTAAGFSGRMPCAELADSIVQCGRRTLETAISFVNSNDRWKARVIYGDTDSMFVLLKGRSVKEAFAIGREIASAVTEMNPTPVTLKMEKVYYPCFLLTKKRYVGYSYEGPDQRKPVFDAKGIETVRRDTCAAVSKTMEQSLRIYFESHDTDKVKSYMMRQWTRILSGRISLEDFVFAKEVRLGTYSANASSLPPAAIVATKLMRADPRAEPRYAERIPYVVVHGEPGARLVDMVVDPHELVTISSPFRLNDIYYIRKQIIPALQRVFGLVGADLNQWFLEMPRPGREGVGKRQSVASNPQRTRIDYYYVSKHCILCGELVEGSAHVCQNCCKDEVSVGAALTGRTAKLEKDIQHLAAICRHCGGGDWIIESGVKCTSLACSVFYERIKVGKELQSLSQAATTTGFYPQCMVDWF